MHTLTPTQQTKWRKRAVSIMLNSIQNLLTPALNITISALVIRVASRDLWGEFVSWLITAQLVAHILAWGNKEYLLRQFSQHPNQIIGAWWSAFVPRLLLLVLICPILIFLDGGWLLILWIAPLFIAQSLDVMVIFRKHFAFAVMTETALTIGMLLALLLADSITQSRLFAVFIIGAWCKALVYGWRYQQILNLTPKSPLQSGEGTLIHNDNKKIPPLHAMGRGLGGGVYFRLALPFFLLGLSGMLASRIDLYTLSAIAPKSDVASYQVVINILLYVQASANFILIPFVKTLYRLDKPTIQKIAMRLFVVGCLIMPIAIIGINLLVGWVYELSYPPMFWWMAGLFALPIFGYLPVIHRLYGQNAQVYVLWVNIIGAVCNGVLNLMLIPILGITGALTASAICQWGMLVAYIFRNLR